ncbi:lytic transglycosylase, partial [bacterium]|nr:lytic transglycosylase [bacterium]
MKFLPAVFLLALPLLMTHAFAAPVTTDDRFLAARDAVHAGDRTKLERIAPDLQDHDLEAYIKYWRLLLDLNTADSAAIKAFLARYEKSYLAEKLRGDWLKQLGKQKKWAEFDTEYPLQIQPDQELSCYALQSRRLRGDASMLDDALPLWLNLIEPP